MPRDLGMLRRYAEFPAFYAPAEGELVLAARSKAGPWLKAAVVKVRRASGDQARIDFVWMENGTALNGTPIVSGVTKGNVTVSKDDPAPLIRRIPASPMPCSDPGEGPERDSGETDL